MHLDAAQVDRACGAVLGSAVGDALGAHYEFTTPTFAPGDGPRMLGGGLGDFEPGEWTDDTSMAFCVLDAAASGVDLRSDAALDGIAAGFRRWYDSGPPDIGNQTSRVLGAAGPGPTGTAMTAIAAGLHAQTGHTGGNGSLMRTAPVALAHLDDPVAMAGAAMKISALTHYDPRAQEACALWSLAIRHAILQGAFDVRAGLAHLDRDGQAYWTARLDEAEKSEPAAFAPNGWVVTALQAAWSSIFHTQVPADAPHSHLVDALTTVISVGNDTDTTAAIAGALLGARWGLRAIPGDWRQISHGYPGRTGEDLVALARQAIAR